MPHAALWVVQPEEIDYDAKIIFVSMPHAALWVVQPRVATVHKASGSFNAARGFVGGATS